MHDAVVLSDRVVGYKRNLLISSAVLTVAAVDQNVLSVFSALGLDVEFAGKTKAVAWTLLLVQGYFILQFFLPATVEFLRSFDRYRRHVQHLGHQTCLVYLAFLSRMFEYSAPIGIGVFGMFAMHYLYWSTT